MVQHLPVSLAFGSLGLIALLPLAVAPGAADEASPRIALALGGGSARGLAHVGVIEVLEEHGIPIDAIAGTSMGACVGALYASGHSAPEVATIARGIAWERIFQGRLERRQEPLAWRLDEVPAIASAGLRGRRLLAPSAALSDYSIGRLLTEHLAAAGVRAGGDFERMPTPFRAVATDLRTGARVVLARGDLPRAVRASMSLPIVFPPVEIDGVMLVDGALSDNVPAGVARGMGADLVIAVDVGAPPRELSEEVGVLDVLNRLVALMVSRGNDASEPPPDVLIRPDLEGIDSSGFTSFDAAIAAGRTAALLALPEIESRLQQRRRVPRDPHQDIDVPRGTVSSVTVKGARSVGEALIRRRLGVEPGAPFDLQAALRGLDSVWASNLFSSAWLELSRDDEGIAVAAWVRERPVTRVGLGLSYDESDNLNGFLRLRHGNLFGQGERLDVAARFSSGLAQFDAAFGSAALGGAALGYRIGLRVAEEKPLVYDAGGERLGRTRFRQDALAASVHRAVGNAALVDLGLMAGHSEVFEQAGIPFVSHGETIVKAAGRIVTDSLDNRFFATSGVRLDLHADQALPGLGASLDYGRAWGRLDAFVPFGRLGLLDVHAFAGLSHGAVPEYELFRVGGPELVPGRARDELWGSWAGAGSLGLGVRLNRAARIYVRGGAGNTWDDKDAVSFATLRAGAGLGFAYDTPLGPASLDLGVGAGRLRVYVALGFQ